MGQVHAIFPRVPVKCRQRFRICRPSSFRRVSKLHLEYRSFQSNRFALWWCAETCRLSQILLDNILGNQKTSTVIYNFSHLLSSFQYRLSDDLFSIVALFNQKCNINSRKELKDFYFVVKIYIRIFYRIVAFGIFPAFMREICKCKFMLQCFRTGNISKQIIEVFNIWHQRNIWNK